ncbi:MAG: cytochrome c peroxidase [Pseudomonadales bacterium]
MIVRSFRSASVISLSFIVIGCGGGGGGSSAVADDPVIPAPTLEAPALLDTVTQIYTQGVATEPFVFTNTGGGSLSSCSATTLPDGLAVEVSVDTETCQIFGTPLTVQSATEYTVTGTNATSSSSATVSILVQLAASTDPLDIALRNLIDQQQLTGDPSTGRNLSNIEEPIAQLGKALFYAKNLGGQQDTACASCHHPSLGGGDNLSLPVGVDAVSATGAVSADLLGPGRFHSSADGVSIIPRNSPSVFNAGMWDSGMFWDSRVQSIDGLNANSGARGTLAGIVTPDSVDALSADINLPSSVSLANAQARFPVVSEAEMRGSFTPAADAQTLRQSLATRLAQSNLSWQPLFEAAFGDGAVSYDRIAEALAAFEESMVFVENPWKHYVEGDYTALSDQQKDGAILFFTRAQDGGGDCSECHSGDFFTDEDHHIVAFPQLGIGKGDGGTADEDYGRERVSGDDRDRYHFKAPSLLNVALTAPYGHSGSYQTIAQVLNHYDNPDRELSDYFGGNINAPGTVFDGVGDFCALAQIQSLMAKTGQNCNSVFNSLNPNAIANSARALDFQNDPQASSTFPNINLGGQERNQIEAFLEALTDPCIENRVCLDPWIIDEGDRGAYPDTLPLIGYDESGRES